MIMTNFDRIQTLNELTELGQKMGDYTLPKGYKIRINSVYEWEKIVPHLKDRGYKLGAITVDDFMPYLFVYNDTDVVGGSIYKECYEESDLSEAIVDVYIREVRI
jgi:hypothetical protein